MHFYVLSILIIFNHFSLFSTNNPSIDNTDKKTLNFSVDAYLDCPWNTQYRHDEQQCGNCKNAKNAMIKEFYTLEDKKVMIFRKSNFEITSFVTSILKEAIQIGLERSDTIEQKKKLITDIAHWFYKAKSNWLSLYKSYLSHNSSKIQLLECAYKQFCSIHLYKTKKIPTSMLKEPKTFNIKLPITSFYAPHSCQNVITAPHGKALLYSFYSVEAIPNLFNIFVLTTVPSERPETIFKADIKYYFWNHITDYLDQKLVNLSK